MISVTMWAEIRRLRKVEKLSKRAIGFAVWHISPQLVMPSEGSMLPFVVSTFFLGLVYGWAAYRTGSVRWTALSHSLNGILTLGVPLSTAILALVSP